MPSGATFHASTSETGHVPRAIEAPAARRVLDEAGGAVREDVARGVGVDRGRARQIDRRGERGAVEARRVVVVVGVEVPDQRLAIEAELGLDRLHERRARRQRDRGGRRGARRVIDDRPRRAGLRPHPRGVVEPQDARPGDRDRRQPVVGIAGRGGRAPRAASTPAAGVVPAAVAGHRAVAGD